MRCFIAVEIPEPLRAAIHELSGRLKKSGSDVTWVSRDNIHITLKFLGDTGESMLPLIRQRLAKILFNYKPFCIRISGAGSFPPGRHSRVLWFGIQEAPLLQALQRDVESGMRLLGYAADERPYQAHITVGRVKAGRLSSEVMKELAQLEAAEVGSFEVRSIALMKSELGRGGPVYTCLAEIPLSYS